MPAKRQRRIPALIVRQWLPEWDEVAFDPAAHRRKPEPCFFLFTIGASELRALAGIAHRGTESRAQGGKDLGIQRRHEAQRSDEIWSYVQYGFPWSSLPKARRTSSAFADLRKPGWLPTAVVVNVVTADETRRGEAVRATDLIQVERDEGTASIVLPDGFKGSDWRPRGLAPLEVIDGQHRLWAFEGRSTDSNFEVPVVAFHGLDISWQAYLFYTVNIKPKKINTSLAYDLYPLLRTEDWLDRFEGHAVYREARAQEITQLLWSHEKSPWAKRIDMLGGSRGRMISQAAWIRTLLATFVKSFEGPGVRIGGLFGAPVGKDQLALPWTRAQQAAFVIKFWIELRDAVGAVELDWSQALREQAGEAGAKTEDPAFSGRFSLLNTDQGVRAVMSVLNDMAWVVEETLEFAEWEGEATSEEVSNVDVTAALGTLARRAKIVGFERGVAAALATYDWRTSGAPGLTEEERKDKARFRGSSGYVELRRDLLALLRRKGAKPLRTAAQTVWEWYDYDQAP